MIKVDNEDLYYLFKRSGEVIINGTTIAEDGKFSYGGKEYTVLTEKKLVCGEVRLTAGGVTIIDGDAGFVKFYGADGKVSNSIQYEIVKGTDEAKDKVKFTYTTPKADNTLETHVVEVVNGETFTYNNVEYKVDIMLKLSTESVNDKMKFTVEMVDDLSELNWWEEVSINYSKPAEAQNITRTLQYYTDEITFTKGLSGDEPEITISVSGITIQSGKEDNYYTKDGNTIKFNAVDKKATYVIAADYTNQAKDEDKTIDLTGGSSAGSNTEKFDGVVLTDDIDLKLINASYPGLAVRLSGNNYIVNYLYQLPTNIKQDLVLFNSITQEVKDVQFAGTIYSNRKNHYKNMGNRSTGLFAKSISKPVENIKIYGSLTLGRSENFSRLTTTRIVKNGEIIATPYAAEPHKPVVYKPVVPIQPGQVVNTTVDSSNCMIVGSLIGQINEEAKGLLNFASYSMFNNNYNGLDEQIDPTIVNGTGACEISNYGTIIGANGAYNCEGQTITLFSSQNVTSYAHNYGIVKAGDGGNGGIAYFAASETKDSTSTNSQPISAIAGGAQKSGAKAGSVILYKKDDSSISLTAEDKAALLSAAGSNGYAGNSSWGGLNLNKYYHTKEGTAKILRVSDGDNEWQEKAYTCGSLNTPGSEVNIGITFAKGDNSCTLRTDSTMIDIVLHFGDNHPTFNNDNHGYSNNYVLYSEIVLNTYIQTDGDVDWQGINDISRFTCYVFKDMTGAVCNGFAINKL